MKPTKPFKRTILKYTNRRGAVMIDGRRFETNTLGQGNRIDAPAYSCHNWAMEDHDEMKANHPNLDIEVIQGEYFI